MITLKQVGIQVVMIIDLYLDPQTPTQTYQYISNAGGTEYALWADLENSTNYWVLCSNGLVGESASAPSGLTICPL